MRLPELHIFERLGLAYITDVEYSVRNKVVVGMVGGSALERPSGKMNIGGEKPLLCIV